VRTHLLGFAGLGLVAQLLGCATSGHPCVAREARAKASTKQPKRGQIPAPPPAEDLGAHVHAAMSCGVDPCEDFYGYACGGYLDARQSGRIDRYMAAGFGQIQERNLMIAHGILLVASSTKDESPEREVLGSFFDACMAQDKVGAAGLDALSTRLAAIDAVSSKQEAIALLVDLQGIDVAAFFRVGATADPRNPRLGMLGLSQPTTPLAVEHLRGAEERSDEYVTAYREYVHRLLRAAGVPAAAARKQSADVVALEQALATKARTATENQQGWMPDLLTFAELVTRDSGFPWLELAKAYGFPLEAPVVFDPRYIGQVERVFGGAELDVLAAYLRWRLILTFARDGNAESRAAQRWFEGEVLHEIPANVVFAHWAHCVDRANELLPELLAQYYVALELPSTSREIAADVAGQVKRGFAERIAGRSWLDPTSRDVALAKLDALAIRVGHPDAWRPYDEIELARADHLANVIRLATLERQLELYSVGRPRDAEAWPSSPIDVNAHFQSSSNTATLNAGLLQWPLFLSTNPMVVNFAGMGAIAGHEIGHAFDADSIDEDAQGRYRVWLMGESRDAYESRVDCIVEDLDGRTASEGGRTIGDLTRDEAIADLAGLRAAYVAWQRWRREHPSQEPAVAGLTDEQLFFLAFAQAHCRQGTEAFERIASITDPHADNRVRVNATLSHVPELAEAFACAPQTPMHPTNVCEVW
jgi:predicted metalloendopeptidase